MKKHLLLFGVILSSALFLFGRPVRAEEAISGQQPETAAEQTIKTGWQKSGGKYYYYNVRGVLQKNKIVGSKSGGYYYVDRDGVRTTTKEIQYAVKFVVKNTKTTQTKKQKLTACFKALCKYPYKHFSGGTPKAGAITGYASYMLKNKKGNCYRYASALAYIACVIGYDSRVAAGRVSISGRKPVSVHGWCEIRIGNTWKICDCSLQKVYDAKHKKLLLLKTRKQYPYRFACERIYSMKMKNGKVSWKSSKA